MPFDYGAVTHSLVWYGPAGKSRPGAGFASASCNWPASWDKDDHARHTLAGHHTPAGHGGCQGFLV